MTDFIISKDDLEWLCAGRSDSIMEIRKDVLAHPLSAELKKERERVMDLILEWMHYYYIPTVIQKMEDLRGEP
jgi:hypothetical protein